MKERLKMDTKSKSFTTPTIELLLRVDTKPTSVIIPPPPTIDFFNRIPPTFALSSFSIFSISVTFSFNLDSSFDIVYFSF